MYTAEDMILSVSPHDVALNYSRVRPYFGDFFMDVSLLYLPVHGYLSLLVCIFGIFANILNIVVLTRKEMLSPTNAILTGLAVADLMVMIEYIPFTIHTSIENYNPPEAEFTFPWAVFTLFHAHFSVVFHSISSWLTVILAVWRYTSVSFPAESKVWCSMKNAKITIGLTYVVVPVICVPLYLSFSIQADQMRVSADSGNETAYFVTFSDFSQMNDGLLRNINFWVFSVGLKLVPCILLTYLSLALIRVLLEAERRRQRLKSNCGVAASHVSVATADGHVAGQTTSSVPAGPSQLPPQSQHLNQGPAEDRRGSDRSQTSFVHEEPAPSSKSETNDKLPLSGNASCSVISSTAKTSHPAPRSVRPHNSHAHVVTASSAQSDRTTKMLLAILLLYLVTEAPNGIISLLVGLIGEAFQNNVYLPLGEIFDILALINSGINFILLASMSRLFRKTFCKIFWPRKYHNHFQRDNNAAAAAAVTAACTEKTNINHQNTIVGRGGGGGCHPPANQSAPQTMSTSLTNRSYSPQAADRLIELNKVSSFITVTEATQDQHEDNDETTMV